MPIKSAMAGDTKGLKHKIMLKNKAVVDRFLFCTINYKYLAICEKKGTNQAF